MAKGKHPVPFRTRKLSPSAPMVLRGGLRGRVGRRRTSFAEGRYRAGSGPQRMLCCPAVGMLCCPAAGLLRCPAAGLLRGGCRECGHRVICRRRGGTQWSGTVVAIAAARRAAATHPSPGALRPGGLVPRAGRRLPRGRIVAALVVPAVALATTTARVPRVAATGLPGAVRPEGPARRRAAPGGRAADPAIAVVARTALGTLASLPGAARAGPVRIRRTLAILAGPGTVTTTAGPVARDVTLVHPRAAPAGGMTARARRPGTGRVAAARRAGVREAASAVLTGPGTGIPARARTVAKAPGAARAGLTGRIRPGRGTAAAVPAVLAGPAARAMARVVVPRPGRVAPAGHRTRRGIARGAAAVPAGPAGLRIRGAVTVPAAGPASAAAHGAVPARVAPAARTAIATTPPVARAGLTRQTPAVAGQAIVTTPPGQAGIAMM